uniref:Sperm flagellar 2 n=1 Tax=Seriola lalandi dorsalis TaxID=1841481 RepID=A0A3B4YRE5_SERLL
MSDILCRWLNQELRLSKAVEPKTFAKDFSSGYLIGEVLHKYQLQNDFSMFMKKDTSISKLNNFTRLEPTLQLLGISFDINTVQELMQEKQGVATRLLYQLYISLEKKKRTEISGTMMEIMQPAANAGLHKKEHGIYSDRLHQVVKRDAELKLQKISEHYEEKCQQLSERSVMTYPIQQKMQLKVQDEKRMKNIEKVLQMYRQKYNGIMPCNQANIVQVPKPPPYTSQLNLRKRQQQQQRRKHQAQVGSGQPIPGDLSLDVSSQGCEVPGSGTKLILQSSSKYIQELRQRIAENAVAREQREKRRDRFLVEQLKAHEAQEEAQREEQLVKRLTRQTQQELRLASQLLQMRMQKEVIRENRLFREQQYQQRREKDFQEALEREAALAQQAKLDRTEEIKKELEFFNRIAAERAQSRYKKHFNSCKDIVEQIVDLATKVGEYRLLTANLIPEKLMREWKELLFRGLPLYEPVKGQQAGFEFSTPLDPVELKKQEILNNQDYDEYTSMVGEWVWPEEAGETKLAPTNNILGHVVLRLRNIVHPPIMEPSAPSFPQFTLKACVLGKFCSGKTTCLAKIAEAYGICVLSADTLIEEALNAYHSGEQVSQIQDKSNVTSLLSLFIESHNIALKRFFRTIKSVFSASLSTRAMLGAAAEKDLREGNAIPNEVLVDIIVEAIRQVPAQSGWILDGFPVDITQAYLLEKALGGSVDVGNEVESSRANLAADPDPPKPLPPPNPVLDLALLLDIPDETVMKHAFNHTGESLMLFITVCTQTLSVRCAHVCIQKKLIGYADTAAETTSHHTDKNLYLAQIPHRITAFQDTWPKLELWYGEKQNILVRVDASEVEEEVYKRVESVLLQVLMQTQEVCDSYVNNIKTVMQQLRSQSTVISHHLFNIREEFKHYLGRPDLKQELVSQWQKDFNSIPDDMREDEDTKAELHLRLDELRERLWDISDKRKEQDEQERASLMCDGWLEDHTAVLINHHATLTQVELDRFQETVCILRVYYLSMYRQVLPEPPSNFVCIPLMETSEIKDQVNIKNKWFSSNLYMNDIHVDVIFNMCAFAIVHACTWSICLYSCVPLCEYVCFPENAAKVRIALVKGHGLVMVQSLQSRAEQAFSDMEKWLEAHYLAEVKSIDQLSEVVRHHIEAAAKLQNELVLECTDFYLNGDCRMVATRTPSAHPPPLEKPTQSTPTITQLESLHQQLCNVAPSGLIPSSDFSSLLRDITAVNMGRNILPEPWEQCPFLSCPQLMEIVALLVDDYELVDWRQFLLSAALPWSFPSLTQLLAVLKRFRAADTGNTGYINREQYLQVKLWFSSESVQPVSEDPSEPLPYDRLANLRKFFFQLFADHSFSPPRLDYVSMLQYFAADPNPRQGFIRALSVVLGQHLKHFSPGHLVRSMPIIEEATELSSSELDGECKEEETSCPSSSSLVGQEVSIPALLEVICHKITKMKDGNPLPPGCLSQEEHTEHLVHVFRELGYKPENGVPFFILSQHPFIQGLMETTTHYQLVVSLYMSIMY